MALCYILVLNSNNIDSKDSKTLSEICITLINEYYFLTPMFKNNHCWFEYTTKSLQTRDRNNNKTILCVFKQLLLDLEIHKHEYTFEMAEINQETPYYLYLCNIYFIREEFST